MNLDHLEDLAKAATPGPWLDCAPNQPIKATVLFVNGVVSAHSVTGDTPSTQAHRDAAYITALSPETVLALIAVARAADGRLDGSYVSVSDALRELENPSGRELGLHALVKADRLDAALAQLSHEGVE